VTTVPRQSTIRSGARLAKTARSSRRKSAWQTSVSRSTDERAPLSAWQTKTRSQIKSREGNGQESDEHQGSRRYVKHPGKPAASFSHRRR